jgi:blue copper oxidase
MNRFTRRTFIIASAAVGAAAGVSWWRYGDEPHRRHAAPAPRDDPAPHFTRRLIVPGADGMFGIVDASLPFVITARSALRSLDASHPSPQLVYEVERNGRVVFNPVLRTWRGARFRAKFWNALDETSIIHWHGLKVESNNDGHPHYAVKGGTIYDYSFTVNNRAGTYWYHPHAHRLSGKQAYLGLSGLFIVDDEEEAALAQSLDLALGVTDIPLLIQDKRLGADGTPVYAPTTEDRFHGHFGDRVLVNFTLEPQFEAATRLYRFRLVNGSSARVYRLAFTHGETALALSLIGSDGGLLERAQPALEIWLSPSERADVLLDLRAATPGDTVMLKSLAFDAMRGNTGTNNPAALPEGALIDIMRIDVTRRVSYARQIPSGLSRIEPVATDGATTRVFTMEHGRGGWRLNNTPYDMLATPLRVKRGSTEIWEFRNPSGGIPHPIHVHGFPFQVLEREGTPAQYQAAGGLGPSDAGWKDTVMLWPGETVRIALDFSHPFLGDQVYMVQCHNLEHEDGGMMLNLKVAA